MRDFDTANGETEQAVFDHLRQHGLFDAGRVDVRVRHGTAYLTGTVPGHKERGTAGEVSGQTERIRQVVNKLRVVPLPVVSDDGLAERIRRALATSPRLSGTEVSIKVIDGVVHLGGSVKNMAEKCLVENEVWAVAGTRNVVNGLEVPSATSRSGAEVAGEIMEALSLCLGLDSSKVSVDFQGGKVRLGGTVPNSHLKSAAEEMVRWMPQVSDVVNELECAAAPPFHSTPSRNRPIAIPRTSLGAQSSAGPVPNL